MLRSQVFVIGTVLTTTLIVSSISLLSLSPKSHVKSINHQSTSLSIAGNLDQTTDGQTSSNLAADSDEETIWYPLHRTTGNSGEDIVFIDPQHGWKMAREEAVGKSEAVTIFKTMDGGKNWIEISKTRTSDGNHDKENSKVLPLSVLKTGITFVNESTGWVGIDETVGEPEIYVTHDGGQTWECQALPIMENSGLLGFVLSPPSFFTKDDGIIVVNNVNSLFYVTHDGGKTWALIEQPSRSGSSGNLSWNFSGIDRNYEMVKNGHVTIGDITWKTTDGGLTWSINP